MRSSLRWSSTLGASAAANAEVSNSSRNNRRRIAAYSVRPDVFGSNLSFLNWKATNLVPVLGNRKSSAPFCRSIRLHGDVFKIPPELMASIGPLSHLPALYTSYLHAGVRLEVKSPGKPATGRPAGSAAPVPRCRSTPRWASVGLLWRNIPISEVTLLGRKGCAQAAWVLTQCELTPAFCSAAPAALSGKWILSTIFAIY